MVCDHTCLSMTECDLRYTMVCDQSRQFVAWFILKLECSVGVLNVVHDALHYTTV